MTAPGLTAQERFELKYVVEPNGHWRWTGAVSYTGGGYGYFWYNGKIQKASRVSWQLHRGEIPEGMFVLHKPECHDRLCICPDHLYLGTAADNVADKIRVGNQVGHNRGFKLHYDDVVCIKKMLRDGIRQSLIAWIYQVAPAHISSIYNGKSWAGVAI